MNPTFNLIEEPWIPCIDLKGEAMELSLRETLARAHELREILDESPLVTASLHRLLLAILHRNFGPGSLEKWIELWREGRFDGEILDAYWDKWHDRFDLFHPERPFYQSLDKELLKCNTTTIAKLAQELASGNNDTLSDHSVDSEPHAMDPSEAARITVSINNYALGGGVAKPFPLSHATLIRGCVILLFGETLLKTLLLNMVKISEHGPIPCSALDCPSWERSKLPFPSKRLPNGYLDLLTWQSRRLKVIPESERNVKYVYITQADALGEGSPDDPHMALRIRDKETGFQALRFNQSRALWRDSHSLLAIHSDQVRPPVAISQLHEMCAREPTLENERISVHVFGFSNDKAKINFWRHERLPLPLDYLKDAQLVSELELNLRSAEETGSKLNGALRNLASHLLENPGNPESKPDKDAVSSLVDSFPGRRHYWASLEPAFYEMYVHLPNNPEAVNEQWIQTLKKMSRNALALTINGLDDSARSLRAGALAQKQLNFSLNNLFPQEETANA